MRLKMRQKELSMRTWPRHPVYRTGQVTGFLKIWPEKKQETEQGFLTSVFLNRKQDRPVKTGNRTCYRFKNRIFWNLK